MLQRFIVSCLCIAALPACGSAALEGDDSPVSADNLLAQTSLQALQESTQDDDAEVGTTTPEESSGTDGCIATTATPSALDPNDLPADYSIAWHFDACTLASDVIQSGDRSVTVNHDRLGRTRTLTTQRNITQDGFDGSQLTVQGTDSMTATGLRRDGSIARVVQSTSTRVRVNGDGSDAYDLTAAYTVNVQDTYKALRLTQRTSAGTGTLQHRRSGARTQVSFAALAFSPTCCYPVSGTLIQVTTAAGGTPQQKTFVFTSTCGHVLVNNRTAVTYPRCDR